MIRKLSIAIVILLVFITSAYSAEVVSREYPYFYKSPRAMGMGGAYVAIGGSADTLFYNPAGLSSLPEDNGWEFNLMELTGEINEDVIDFVNDMQDAFDVGDVDMDGDDDDDMLRAVNEVLANYRGVLQHLRISDFLSIAKKSGRTAYAFGGLASLRLDGIPHQGFGANGILEVNGDAYFGGIGGVSYSIANGIHFGTSLKYLYRESLIHAFTSRELVEHESDLGDYIRDNLLEYGSTFGVDAGVIYDIPVLDSLKPSVGFSVMNIGDMDFGDAGEMPMTVNVGIAVSPQISAIKSLTIGLDYVDILNNFDQDSDVGKRIRFGGELSLFSKKSIGAMLRAGIYQGYATFGADLRLKNLTLSYVTYAEEVGAYAGQDDDRRHLAMIKLGW